MEVEIVEVKEEEKEVLLNLIEKYLYEFSQWEKTDVNVEEMANLAKTELSGTKKLLELLKTNQNSLDEKPI